jgi:putative two-component system response regulator
MSLTKIIYVDDDADLLESVSELLSSEGFTVFPFTNGLDALERLRQEEADLVLTDIKMPNITGIELLEKIRAVDTETPVILTTGYADLNTAIDAIKKGAFEFIIKPFDFDYLILAINKGVQHKQALRLERDYKTELEKMVVQRTRELSDALKTVKNMSRVVIERLTAAAEFRDNVTGRHISRIGHYSAVIASVLGMPDDFIDTISVASAMHDIGKIGIPDSILHKPGPLTPDETKIIESHTTIGAKILKGTSFPLMQMAASIALSHHERWDGSGYPEKLHGRHIPIEARIVMLADQYDALRSQRAYKPPFDHITTFEILTSGDRITRPEHFDPDVLDAFKRADKNFAKIYEKESNVVKKGDLMYE